MAGWAQVAGRSDSISERQGTVQCAWQGARRRWSDGGALKLPPPLDPLRRASRQDAGCHDAAARCIEPSFDSLQMLRLALGPDALQRRLCMQNRCAKHPLSLRLLWDRHNIHPRPNRCPRRVPWQPRVKLTASGLPVKPELAAQQDPDVGVFTDSYSLLANLRSPRLGSILVRRRSAKPRPDIHRRRKASRFLESTILQALSVLATCPRYAGLCGGSDT